MMILNPIEEITKELPQLAEIKDTDSNREFVPFQNWDNRLKSISTKNLHKYKSAVTGTSLEPYFRPCIICIHPDDKLIEINKEKYKLIRKHVMSEEYHR